MCEAATSTEAAPRPRLLDLLSRLHVEAASEQGFVLAISIAGLVMKVLKPFLQGA